MDTSCDRLIDPEVYLRNSLVRKLYRSFGSIVERFFAVDQANKLYSEIEKRDFEKYGADNFFDATLNAMGVSYASLGGGQGAIPRQGSVICVANHPFGGVEGLIMGSLLASSRADSRLLSVHLLECIHGLAAWSFFCSPSSSKKAVLSNYGPLRKAYSWLKEGHCLGIFPSGEVSTFQFKKLSTVDPVWNPKTARLILKTKATVVPVFFYGRNSIVFHALGLLSLRLRNCTVAREFFRMRGRNIALRIGRPITPKKLANFGSSTELMEFIKRKTYGLKKIAQE